MMAANNHPPKRPGASKGTVTVNITFKGDAPRLAAACSRRSSMFSMDTYTLRITNGSTSIT
ncbi:hypothetical protein D3C80_2138690 [compost metagenome]